MNPNREWCESQEAAQILCIKPETLRNWISSDKFGIRKHVRKFSARKNVYNIEGLKQLLIENTKPLGSTEIDPFDYLSPNNTSFVNTENTKN